MNHSQNLHNLRYGNNPPPRNNGSQNQYTPSPQIYPNNPSLQPQGYTIPNPSPSPVQQQTNQNYQNQIGQQQTNQGLAKHQNSQQPIRSTPQSNPYSYEDSFEKEEIEKENYYTNTLIIALIGAACYYIGSSLIIFFTNVGGEQVVTLPSYEISWRLLFSNFPELIRNLFYNVFGYFIQYAKLFGFFEDVGTLTQEPKERYLLPLDILIKLSTIAYFHFRWMVWDTKRSFKLGIFAKTYPYVKLSKKELEEKALKEEEERKIGEEIEKDSQIAPDLYPQIQNNPYYKAQQKNLHEDEDEDDDEEGSILLPFEGVLDPIVEWYQQNEVKIYGFIRTRVLPGSNLILALYFSATRVLDLSEPGFILLYLLGITSMFWCMQTFLIILDHNQYPPDDEPSKLNP